MTTCTVLARLAHYLHEFNKASHIFLKRGLWQMCQVWQVSWNVIFEHVWKNARRVWRGFLANVSTCEFNLRSISCKKKLTRNSGILSEAFASRSPVCRSATSRRKCCSTPPSKPARHWTSRESVVWLTTEQFVGASGGPG